MSTKLVKSKSGNVAITKWSDEMAKYAQEAAGSEQTPSGSFVSLRGGVLSFQGSPAKDNKAQVVILDNIYENTLYTGKFDPESPQPPSCYAFARDEKDLKPHEKASAPQHDQCSGCEHNVFGSAETGKGKACKNTRRLALLSANGLSAQTVRDYDVLHLKIPVTSVKGWSYYVKGIATTLKRPPFGVVTELAVVPDPKSQFRLVFTCVSPIDDAVMGAVMERRKEIMEQIAFPYPEASAAPKAKAAPSKARKF